MICTSHKPNSSGYPRIMRNGSMKSIARLILERRHGPQPSSIQARHECDNKMCIRPDHIVPGTNADNGRDYAIRSMTPHTNNSSGIKGVYSRYGKWQARIEISGRSIYLGAFADKEAAVAAYQRAFQMRAVVLWARNRAAEIARDRLRSSEGAVILRLREKEDGRAIGSGDSWR
jgi:hypothetical protein